MYLSEFVTIALAHLFAVASPGPDFAIVLRNSIVYGQSAGVWTSLGVACGILLHVSYSLLGIGLLLSQSELLFTLVKVLGAGYLFYLGVSAIRQSMNVQSSLADASASSNPKALSLVMSGFLTNGLNPKATLFFLALFTVIINTETPLTIQLAYGLYLCVATFIWFAALSRLLGRSTVRQFLLRRGYWFERLMGVVLIALGARLAFSLVP